MTTIKAVVRNGRIDIDQPLDLPEGEEAKVTVRPIRPTLRGMSAEEQGDSPEAIERWIARLAAIPAPVMTDVEWAAMQERRREDR